MIAEGTVKHYEPLVLPSRDELIRRVQSQTHRQVRDLEIDCRGRSIKVSGRSTTYYVKQLVTQAILSTVPAAQLENDIHVQTI